MNKVYKKSVIDSYGISFDIPKHVGIIMDGNGRWAKRRAMPRIYGHKAGMDRLHGIVKTSSDIGIESLTLYAFSTENWARPKLEVEGLMRLLVEYFTRYIDELNENQVRICHLGELNSFSAEIAALIQSAVERTADNYGLTLNLALNYGSRQEIVRAVKLISHDVAEGRITPDDIDERLFASKLYTGEQPDLDVLIRTSGEQRLSNFLLYQAAYAELVFVDECWPDFTDARYVEALFEYARRDRRFGGLNNNK